MTTLIQVMSLQQPANGWFVPNCHDETLFLATESIEQRKNVQVPLFTNGESKNLFQVLNNWLTKDIEDDQYQAIEQFGVPNEGKKLCVKFQFSDKLKFTPFLALSL